MYYVRGAQFACRDLWHPFHPLNTEKEEIKYMYHILQ
jgi:hypothetical protein